MPGSMTNLLGFLSRPVTGSSDVGSPVSTTDFECDILVVLRTMIGVSNCSLTPKAKRVKSSASWLSAGSNIGTLANELSKESHFAERSSKQLVSGVPLKWWVIDLEDGIRKGVKGKKVKPEELTSVPMQALWEGMTALPWKGPPPVDAKGFMSVMLSATTDPSIDPSVGRRFADKNYIIVAKNFCNVSTRLGFHFSTIEAYVGEEENQNYISLVYTGGGADEGRKGRRAALISRLLEKYDFRVEKREDTIFARIEGHKRPLLEDRLKVLGHIIVHTRQMDMVMYNDAMVEWYYKDMLKGIESFVEISH